MLRLSYLDSHLVLLGCFIWKGYGTLMCRFPPMPVETEQAAPQPPSLDDIQVTIIRVGRDVTLLLDWQHTQHLTPFHIWVEVDGSNVVLNSPVSEPRTIEVVLEAELVFFGSTLYHELTDNRLAIDLQVKHTDQKEQPQ